MHWHRGFGETAGPMTDSDGLAQVGRRADRLIE